MTVCAFCGTAAPPTSESRANAGETGAEGGEPATAVPLTWVTSVENGVRKVYCDRCAREHLRSIEAKLDAQWW